MSEKQPQNTRFAAEAAFAAGDYVRVRELAAGLDASDGGEDARAVRALAGRTRPDLGQIAILTLATLLVAWIAWKYVF